jgi:peptidoglycan/LPS O-acetylase OafA/YrhL
MMALQEGFVLLLYLISFFTAFLLNRKFAVSTTVGRYESIDGLRGLLALGVFFHHALCWFEFLKKGIWQAPDSSFVAHLGQTSVAFFFMITSFLFVTKLLDARPFSWRDFMLSRVLRLVPRYYAVVIMVIVLCFAAYGFRMEQGWPRFLAACARWLLFTIPSKDYINGFPFTNIVTAGVVWTLPYEWLFYCSLPLLALVLRRRVPLTAIAASVLFILFFLKYNMLDLQCILAFAAGGIAPVLMRYGKKQLNFDSPIVSLVVCLLFLTIPFFRTASSLYCKLLLAAIFTLIAMGNTAFGFLKLSFLKFLGEICYSTYLLHGIVLFVWIYFGVGLDDARAMDFTTYGIGIIMLTPVVILLSYVSFRWIEKPFMDLSYRLRSGSQGEKQKPDDALASPSGESAGLNTLGQH